ncbi:MAG: heavy metal translocating P-type ATPase [Anaerolineae bacterium]
MPILHYEYTVKGLDCPDCALALQNAITRLKGVSAARLVYATARLYVDADMTTELAQHIARTAEELGYQLETSQGTSVKSSTLNWLRARLKLIEVVGMGVLIIAGFALRWFLHLNSYANYLFLAAIVTGGIPLLRETVVTLVKTRKVDMNVLMTIAIIGAVALGDYPEGAATLLLLTIGELLEQLAAERARRAISNLLELAPSEAILVSAEGQRLVPTAQLRIGDLISIRPGERLPIDGTISEGQSYLEEAAITGESLPVEKTKGAKVFAGSINGQGALIVQVSSLASDSTLSRIIKLVEQAQARQSGSERMVDRFARVYTPIVVAAAVIIAVLPPILGLGEWRVWLYRALVPLVVACPCALVLSTPVTMVSGLARAAKSGVIIKGGIFLERLAQLKAIAFDKTGTLTIGKPQVIGGECAPDHSDTNCEHCLDLIAKAASLERRSEHVLGKAVTAEAAVRGVAERYPIAEGVQALPGKGISGEVNGHRVAVGSVRVVEQVEDAIHQKARAAQGTGNTVLMIQDACCDESCFLLVADQLRPEAKKTIQALANLGIEHTVMLTGDSQVVAERLGRAAGIAEVKSELMPEQKVEAVEQLVSKYNQVAMVGDGINDAPALAAASVGVAMGLSGTDIAVETADVSLLSDDLMRIPWAIRLARRTTQLVKMNITLALAIKGIFLVLAVFGFTTLWMAVLADTGSSLLVTGNGLRVLRFKDR